jgi:hypothetical protein
VGQTYQTSFRNRKFPSSQIIAGRESQYKQLFTVTRAKGVREFASGSAACNTPRIFQLYALEQGFEAV